MQRRNCGTIGTWALVVLLAASALGEQGTSLLKPGDALPPLAGRLSRVNRSTFPQRPQVKSRW